MRQRRGRRRLPATFAGDQAHRQRQPQSAHRPRQVQPRPPQVRSSSAPALRRRGDWPRLPQLPKARRWASRCWLAHRQARSFRPRCWRKWWDLRQPGPANSFRHPVPTHPAIHRLLPRVQSSEMQRALPRHGYPAQSRPRGAARRRLVRRHPDWLGPAQSMSSWLPASHPVLRRRPRHPLVKPAHRPRLDRQSRAAALLPARPGPIGGPSLPRPPGLVRPLPLLLRSGPPRCHCDSRSSPPKAAPY